MPETTKLSLNAGELSDELAGRIDLKKFNTGCEVLENARVLRAGGVTRRAGFEYVDDVEDNARKTRLVGFRFSEDQGCVLELSHLTMRVIHDGVVEATVYVTPWTEDQVFALQFAQRIDRIVVTHPEVPVNSIIRHADDTWSVGEYPWVARVWELYPSSSDYILTPGATTGNTTITSDTALFLDDSWEGDRIRIDHNAGEVFTQQFVFTVNAPEISFNQTGGTYSIGDLLYDTIGGRRHYFMCIADYDGGTDYVSGDDILADYPAFFEQSLEIIPPTVVGAGWVFETFETWDGTYWVQRSYNEGLTWHTIKVIESSNDRNERVVETETEVALIRVIVPEFSTSDNRYVEFTANSYPTSGSAVITARNSDTEVDVTVEEDFFSTDAATAWYEAAFSPRNGYPTGVTFYQSRLCFGGTTSRPQTLWLSRSEKPFDFTFGTLATDGMSFTTDAEGYESIAWLSSHLSLLVGTTLGVWAIASPNGNSLTPENNSINRQMQLGAQEGFQAAPLQSNVLFLQYKGRKVQELTGGSVEYGGYLSADLTQLATHVTRGGVDQIATSELPDSTLFLVNGGEISLLTYERAQNVVGWARWTTDGIIESLTTTSGAGEEDDHWAVVNRGGNRYIEHLAPDMLRVEEDNDVVNLRFLDCYTEKVEVSDFTEITGLTRFNGLEVDTFIDGEPGGPITVAAGVATLPHAGKNVVVGLPYTTEVRPMPIDFGSIGSKSAVIEMVIRFRNSLGGETSQDQVNWSKIDQTPPRTTDGTPLPLLSHDFKSTPHSTWERKPSISVRQTQPLPMTILAMRLKTKSSK